MSKISQTKCSREQCLVIYFDIHGFSKNAMENDEDSLKRVLDVWTWIDGNIKKKETVVTYLFSDCGFLLYVVKEPRRGSVVLKQCIQDLELMLDVFLENGFVVRGGASFGPVTYARNIVIGQAVVEAVRFESKYCPGPFIVIPRWLIDELTNNQEVLGSIDLTLLVLKGEGGMMECHLVLPQDRDLYLKRIISYRDQHVMSRRDFQYGKFWDDAYRVVKHHLELKDEN